MSTAGEGGMLTTSSETIWRSAWSMKDHGRDPDLALGRTGRPGFRWQIGSFGTNWRLTELQAAIGRVQLHKLPLWVNKRRENASILTERFSGLPSLRVAVPPPHVGHAYYKYYFFVRPEQLKSGWNRDRVLAQLLASGVSASVGVCPEVYRERAFLQSGLAPAERFPVAQQLGETSLCFPVHPTLEAKDVHRMADIMERVLEDASQ